MHDRFGPARHSVEARASPRMRVETRFLEQVAAAIDIGLDRFDEVVLCAPPRSLGVLRVCVSDAVREHLRAELAKDYVGETPKRLGALLAQAMS